MYKFNYIITCHNKEKLIQNVVTCIINVSEIESNIYVVLDGCNDKTEYNLDNIIQKYPERNIIKIYTDDVHELLAINAALRFIDHNEKRLNIILQDDVLLMDTDMEMKLNELYREFPKKLGIVSLRHGANLSKIKFMFNDYFQYPHTSYVSTIFDLHSSNNKLLENEFVTKHFAFKSPICIPSIYIQDIGICNENFSPWDDFEYCFRGIINGYVNGVISLNYYSHVSWGTMRNVKQKIKHNDIVKKNIRLLKSLYYKSIVSNIKNELFFLHKIENGYRLKNRNQY